MTTSQNMLREMAHFARLLREWRASAAYVLGAVSIGYFSAFLLFLEAVLATRVMVIEPAVVLLGLRVQSVAQAGFGLPFLVFSVLLLLQSTWKLFLSTLNGGDHADLRRIDLHPAPLLSRLQAMYLSQRAIKRHELATRFAASSRSLMAAPTFPSLRAGFTLLDRTIAAILFLTVPISLVAAVLTVAVTSDLQLGFAAWLLAGTIGVLLVSVIHALVTLGRGILIFGASFLDGFELVRDSTFWSKVFEALRWWSLSHLAKLPHSSSSPTDQSTGSYRFGVWGAEFHESIPFAFFHCTCSSRSAISRKLNPSASRIPRIGGVFGGVLFFGFFLVVVQLSLLASLVVGFVAFVVVLFMISLLINYFRCQPQKTAPAPQKKKKIEQHGALREDPESRDNGAGVGQGQGQSDSESEVENVDENNLDVTSSSPPPKQPESPKMLSMTVQRPTVDWVSTAGAVLAGVFLFVALVSERAVGTAGSIALVFLAVVIWGVCAVGAVLVYGAEEVRDDLEVHVAVISPIGLAFGCVAAAICGECVAPRLIAYLGGLGILFRVVILVSVFQVRAIRTLLDKCSQMERGTADPAIASSPTLRAVFERFPFLFGTLWTALSKDRAAAATTTTPGQSTRRLAVGGEKNGEDAEREIGDVEAEMGEGFATVYTTAVDDESNTTTTTTTAKKKSQSGGMSRFKSLQRMKSGIQRVQNEVRRERFVSLAAWQLLPRMDDQVAAALRERPKVSLGTTLTCTMIGLSLSIALLLMAVVITDDSREEAGEKAIGFVGSPVPSPAKLSHPLCAMQYPGGFSTLDLSYMTDLTYRFNETAFFSDVNTWFGARVQVTQPPKTVVQGAAAVSWFELEAPNVRIVAIRGTAIGRDFLADLDLFAEGALMSIAYSLFPGSSIIAPDVAANIADALAAIGGAYRPSQVLDLVQPVIDATNKNPLPQNTTLLFIGHSLGGSIAAIAGSLSDHPAQIFAAEPPGLAITRGKFGISLATLENRLTLLLSQRDPVRIIEDQAGSIFRWECDPNLGDIDCHFPAAQIRFLTKNCGDPYGRGIDFF